MEDEFSSTMPPATATPPVLPDSTRRAVIDVGTNSIKLLIADVAGHLVEPVFERSQQTRLGRGFYETHVLQSGAIAGTAEAVARFAAMAREWNVKSLRVIATSAARDATNPRDLTRAIESASGQGVEIISGDQEAEWAFHGVTSDPELADLSLLILDVGGGSTELILGEGTRRLYTHSCKLGTVRLLEQFDLHDPPGREALAQCRRTVHAFIAKNVAPSLQPELRSCAQPVHLVGTGGTGTILGRMQAGMTGFDRALIEVIRPAREDLRAQAERLWSLPLEQRKQVPGLPPKRADVILMGVVIYEAILEQLNFSEMRISTRGLRYAALMDPGSLGPGRSQ
jgi:exopolyphosphatase / guanosine-5'-triphosphate,3'-diphosphate pyrophosphatase